MDEATKTKSMTMNANPQARLSSQSLSNPSRRSLGGRISRAVVALVVTTGMTAVAQADLSDTGCHDLHIQGAKAKYVNFPKGFVFLMGGVPHAGVWVHGNGYVSFGGVGMPDSSPTPAELLGRADEFSLETGMMRIAPLWTDLNPNPSDRGRVYAGAVGSTEYRISWVNVPFRNVPGKSVTMSLVLRRNGSFQIVYEDVPAIYGDTICGYAGGHEHTNVAGPQSDLSALSGTVGNGTQPHPHEALDHGLEVRDDPLDGGIFAGDGLAHVDRSLVEVHGSPIIHARRHPGALESEPVAV
jgi:hypothetical protein